MKVSLRQLRYALAAARHGNLTAAANDLHVSQPSISIAITQIEDILGQPLFVRQRGAGVTLTPFGRRALVKAARIVTEADEFQQLGLGDDILSGNLDVGCYEDLSPYCVPSVLRQLTDRHPHLKTRVREGSFQTIARQLLDGTVDIALTYDLGLPNGVSVELIGAFAPYAIFPAGHQMSGLDAVTLDELARYPLILSDQQESWKFIYGFFQSRDLNPLIGGKMHSFEMQRAMVANGFGVAIGYTRPFGQYAYDGKPLVHRPIADALPMQQLVVAFDERRPLSRAASDFVMEARRWFIATHPGAQA